MQGDQGSAPSWLYSFVDLAFLLLIVLSLTGLDHLDSLDLGELKVPLVHASTPLAAPDRPGDRWQLRVHATHDRVGPVFELAPVGAAPRPTSRFDRRELHGRLAELRQEGARKPLLAPHEDSRSADLLEAVGLLETLWPVGRSVLVAPAPEAP